MRKKSTLGEFIFINWNLCFILFFKFYFPRTLKFCVFLVFYKDLGNALEIGWIRDFKKKWIRDFKKKKIDP